MLTIDSLNRVLAPIRRRIDNMVARAVVRSSIDSTKLRELQIEILRGELRDRVEHFQEYGFTSRPLDGAEVVGLFVGGSRDHPLIIASEDRRYRIKNLEKGEVALYTDEGDYIHFKRGGNIEVLAGTKVKVTAPDVEIIASTKVTITSPLVTMSGNLEVSGNVAVDGNVQADGTIVSSTSVADPNGTMQEMRSTYNTHTHPENGTGGGTTSAPNQTMT
jgi:phage baseplate assembly protein V